MIKPEEDEIERAEVITHEHKLIYRPVGYDEMSWHCDSLTLGLVCGRGHVKGVFK